MDNEPEVIRREMAETRASLADKLETLENQVVGTLHGANSAVNETVENVTEAVQATIASVKDTVSDTVDSMKDMFNLKLQVDRHPCLMMGAAVAVGYLGGFLLNRAGGHPAQLNGRQYPPSGTAWPGERRPAGSLVEERHPVPATSTPAVAENGLAARFGPELAKLKGMVIGYVMGMVRDAVSEALPSTMRTQFNETVDSATQKLGGQPVRGPILECTDQSATTSVRGRNGSEERTGRSYGEFRR